MKNKMKNRLIKIFVLLLCVGILSTEASHALPHYQLRDVSGQRDGHTIAGSQWFATAEEGYWNYDSTPPLWGRRWVTVGGEAPGVTMVTSADLIQDFAPVYINDPLYNNWWDHYAGWRNDASFDVLQSVYLVIKEGRGELNLDFGNNYAHYAPFPGSGPQDAMEDVLLSVPEYTTRVEPGEPRFVASGDWLPVSMFFSKASPNDYGSELGYLTFRQSASFDVDFKGYLESIKIPLVVANVFDGPASEPGNELYFDMSVFDGSEVLTRKKFRWGADQNETRDLGTFFMIRPAGASAPTYDLSARITNRTGVRYRNQRYDYISSTYRDIYPSYWSYDLPPESYASLATLFDREFQLAPQSQIAPGLITTYLNTMDMVYGSSESFRLYPYQGSDAPRELRLTYRKVGGMTPYGSPVGASSSPWTVGAFNMKFADVASNDYNTAKEIAGYAGGNPVMPAAGYAFAGVADQYIKADAFNSFIISADVPAGLVGSGDVAVLPLRVRMRISRREAPLVGRWDEIANAENVVTAFSQACAIWIRSPNHTVDPDVNLFTALRDRGYSAERCIQAFTYNDFLYLDFIVLLADAVSQNVGYKGFFQVVEDDNVPYILIGDGGVDNAWTLGFYAAVAGSDYTPPPPPLPPTPGPGGGGGGGCDIGSLGVALLCLLFLLGFDPSNKKQ